MERASSCLRDALMLLVRVVAEVDRFAPGTACLAEHLEALSVEPANISRPYVRPLRQKLLMHVAIGRILGLTMRRIPHCRQAEEVFLMHYSSPPLRTKDAVIHTLAVVLCLPQHCSAAFIP
jgi:hypothetical protein